MWFQVLLFVLPVCLVFVGLGYWLGYRQAEADVEDRLRDEFERIVDAPRTAGLPTNSGPPSRVTASRFKNNTRRYRP